MNDNNSHEIQLEIKNAVPYHYYVEMLSNLQLKNYVNIKVCRMIFE